jgi:A/G-specific adenine glycosylase
MEVISEGPTVGLLRARVLEWYRTSGRSFPWRQPGASSYAVVLSELLLQRTRAETVGKHISVFFDQFPDWPSLAKADEGELVDAIKPFGLYNRRSKAIRGLAVEMAKRNYVLPDTREELESLPGVGQYIANAILLYEQSQPQPLLDENMARVIERFFGYSRKRDLRFDVYLQMTAKEIVNCVDIKKINWAILDFGALVCRPRNPRCDACPMVGDCMSSRLI